MGLTTLEPGTVFAGDFNVVRLLAEGGMGSVYVVEQRSTGKPRALKVMHPRMLLDPALRERFTQEARLGARIESDHVVEVVGAGLDADTGIPWMAMELLHGRELAMALTERGAFLLPEAQDILRQVGHALTRAHHLGIVHRDLKPENIFLADTRRDGGGAMVKILDFGIAKVMQETRATGATLGGLGTPLWMAPEQTHGGLITPATDVWALGLIGFALLTGRSYWKCATADAPLTVVLTEMFAAPMPAASARVVELGLPVQLPAGFDAWFSQCVAREASERFRTAEPCVAAFLALGSAPHRAIAAPPTRANATAVGLPSVPRAPATPPLTRSPRRGWVPAVVAAALLIPALGLGAWVASRPTARVVAVRPAPATARAAMAESQPVREPVPPAPIIAPAPPPMEVAAAPEPVVAPQLPAVPPSRRTATRRHPSLRAASAAPPSVPAYSAVRPSSPAPTYAAPPVAQPAPVQPSSPAPAPVPVEAPPLPSSPGPSTAPGAQCGPCSQGTTERCNGCDDNCNGMVDEGC